MWRQRIQARETREYADGERIRICRITCSLATQHPPSASVEVSAGGLSIRSGTASDFSRTIPEVPRCSLEGILLSEVKSKNPDPKRRIGGGDREFRQRRSSSLFLRIVIPLGCPQTQLDPSEVHILDPLLGEPLAPSARQEGLWY